MNRTLLPALLFMTGVVSSISYYPVFLGVLACLLYGRHGRIPLAALKPLVPLAVLVLAGLVFIDTNAVNASLRDLWYISKILLVALTGLLIGVSYSVDPRWFPKLIAVAFILAIINVAYVFSGNAAEGGRFLSYLSAFIAPFILRYFPGRGVLAVVTRLAFVVPSIVMIVLSGSRAGLMTLVVSYLASRGVFQRVNKTLLAVGTASVLAIVIWPMLPQYDAGNITFLGKIQNAANEITFETGANRNEMYANWRGFEAYRAFQTWLNASFIQQTVGLGFGHSIDLGQWVAFGNGEVEALPFVHNAYFTLLIKTGAVGVVSIVFFLLLPFRISLDRQDTNAVVLSQISRGTSVALLLTTALISGPLNKASMDGVTLLWAWSSGALIRKELQSRARMPHAGRRAGLLRDRNAARTELFSPGRGETGG